MKYKNIKKINLVQLENLYNDVGWYAYTNDLTTLQSSLKNSLDVTTAWENDKLVGLIRVIGDGLSIIYIQDILVLKSYQNKGVGTQLMNIVLDKYKNVRQKVLLTDDTLDVRHFYEKMGFVSCDKGDLVAFAKIS